MDEAIKVVVSEVDGVWSVQIPGEPVVNRFDNAHDALALACAMARNWGGFVEMPE